MTILAIETSCDETAIALLSCSTVDEIPTCVVLGNALLSQVETHKEYGGVYPMLAKREHVKNIMPLFEDVLIQAGRWQAGPSSFTRDCVADITRILEREPELRDVLIEKLSEIEPPAIDAIAVTAGPGLEPALWVGVNFARTLSILWHIPVVSVNHMEGHVLGALATATIKDKKMILSIPTLSYPLVSLLISGGHTELVLSKEAGSYELLGATRDDAVGEAFDKVARMLGLPYPGGPEISKLAQEARLSGRSNPYSLPRPMIRTDDYDFSFSGLKTAALYLVKDKELSDADKTQIAQAFEDAVAEVLYAKTERALEATGARALAIGGGVAANSHIAATFTQGLAAEHPNVQLSIPEQMLTTDNALMIGLAGYIHAVNKDFTRQEELGANGSRKLG